MHHQPQTNADLLVDLLRERGVRWAFGIPSGPVLPLLESMRKRGIEFVLTASETSAGFMATTVGALTGTPGVCVATLGPGATNLTTGVGAAWLDRAPVLAITCNVATAWLDRRIQMRIDHHMLFAPLTKSSCGLRTPDFGDTVSHALSLASTEPPGPVHVDLPEDVARAPVAAASLHRPAFPPSTALAEIGPEVVATAARALASSRRPLVVTGLTLTRTRAADSLLRFVESHRIPFVSTLHAKGMLPESHPLWAGVLGRARRTDVQAFIDRADLIVAIGFDPVEINYEEWIRQIPLVHISTEPADVSSDVDVLVNAAGNLDGAIERLVSTPVGPNAWTDTELLAHRQQLDAALRPPSSGFGPQHVLDVLRAHLPADGILAYDVGAHTHQIATQWRTDRPCTCISTNGWSSMGFGMPAGYAARLVHPERTVVAVVGDGCFRMTVGELDLARRLNLAVPVVVLNDGWLGLMKVKQERQGYPLYGVRLAEPPPSPTHYFGVPSRPATSEAEFADALDWAFSVDGPTVIEAFIDVEPYSQTVYD